MRLRLGKTTLKSDDPKELQRVWGFILNVLDDDTNLKQLTPGEMRTLMKIYRFLVW